VFAILAKFPVDPGRPASRSHSATFFIEITRAHRRWLTGLGLLTAIFEIVTVLTLRVHYTIEVVIGIVSGLCATNLADSISTAMKSRKMEATL
jgi:hypothetical protein